MSTNKTKLPQPDPNKQRNAYRQQVNAESRKWLDDALALLGHQLGDGDIRAEAQAWEIFAAVCSNTHDREIARLQAIEQRALDVLNKCSNFRGDRTPAVWAARILGIREDEYGR